MAPSVHLVATDVFDKSSPASQAPASPTSIVFVCCVESGPLEDETVRLASSLRQCGGGLAGKPIIAVSPRRDVRLKASTVAAFRTLDVTHVAERVNRKYAWFPFMNKINALQIAERRVSADAITWLDSDILVLAEPTVFCLDDETDLGACTGSRHGGTAGPADREDASWAAMCRAVGLSIDELPWVTTSLDRVRVRFYLNSGVFAYHASTRFGDHFFDCMVRVLEARIASDDFGIDLIEQAVFGLAIVRAELRFRCWPDEYNYNVVPTLQRYCVPERVKTAKVLHYHRSMAPQHWDRFLDLIKRTRPELVPWLEERGPIEYRYAGPLARRLLRRPLQVSRILRWRWHGRCCGTRRRRENPA